MSSKGPDVGGLHPGGSGEGGDPVESDHAGGGITPAYGVTEMPGGFEEHDDLRSQFIRRLVVDSHLDPVPARREPGSGSEVRVPRTLIRFWHDPHGIPSDVQACMDSWDRLAGEYVTPRLFDDSSARVFIANRYGRRHLDAFTRCAHPAMRSDYLRLCVVYADGGLYVDADDVLLDDGWRRVFDGPTLKLQPLCYDIAAAGMIPVTDVGVYDTVGRDRIYYVNNNPLAAPPGHSVVGRALERATRLLLDDTHVPEIQSTTGPGNLTAALAAVAYADRVAGRRRDTTFLFGWERTAEPDWTLTYRNDHRNWRLLSDWRRASLARLFGRQE